MTHVEPLTRMILEKVKEWLLHSEFRLPAHRIGGVLGVKQLPIAGTYTTGQVIGYNPTTGTLTWVTPPSGGTSGFQIVFDSAGNVVYDATGNIVTSSGA